MCSEFDDFSRASVVKLNGNWDTISSYNSISFCTKEKQKKLTYNLTGIDPNRVETTIKGRTLSVKVDGELQYNHWLEDWVNVNEITVELKWGLLTVQLAPEDVEKKLEIKK